MVKYFSHVRFKMCYKSSVWFYTPVSALFVKNSFSLKLVQMFSMHNISKDETLSHEDKITEAEIWSIIRYLT